MEMQTLSPETGSAAGSVTVPDEAFGAEYNEPLVHQVVVAYMAGGRAGTRAQRSRSQVRATGAKPWRQKGTGRARAGTVASPLWRGGGVTFAARPRHYEQKVNKKMYRGAMRAIWSELGRQERLLVLEDLQLAEPKTRLLAAALERLQVASALIVVDQADASVYLAARNMPSVDVCDVVEINPVDLLRFDKVLVTKAALARVAERLA